MDSSSPARGTGWYSYENNTQAHHANEKERRFMQPSPGTPLLIRNGQKVSTDNGRAIRCQELSCLTSARELTCRNDLERR